MCQETNKNMNAVESLLFLSLILKYLSLSTCTLGGSSGVHLFQVTCSSYLQAKLFKSAVNLPFTPWSLG